MAVLGGSLYAVGGNINFDFRNWLPSHANALNTVERFDPRTGIWHTISAMINRRMYMGCAVYNKCLYVAGGKDGLTSMSSVERYDPIANKWTPVGAMNTRLAGVRIRV